MLSSEESKPFAELEVTKSATLSFLTRLRQRAKGEQVDRDTSRAGAPLERSSV